MCGRFAQNRKPHRYAEALGLLPEQVRLSGLEEPIGRFNVCPATRVHLLHLDDDGLYDDEVMWGWKPHWATGKQPMPRHAQIETLASGSFFRAIWKSGRALVGADGWYEWKTSPDDPKLKQPYYFRRKGDLPLHFAVIGQFPRNGRAEREGDGFVILTGASDGGLAGIHPRKPLVLPPDLARVWLAPTTLPEEAEEIARLHSLAAEDFEWFPVGREVGNSRNDHPGLIEPITDPVV
ncbi:SOS response-associated peptidase family protein [Pseudomonas sp. LFM046]|uniref:SOS response-associated peptidase family protein n=1 Tax=Pseudomonas sp. LFM046 TaxID=1608357 RepID=UPI0005CFEA7E|nr:SOS response-associated peptidase family protein [Pseudomonas sp. LFM046]